MDKKAKELEKNYKQQKMDFLDSLEPDDFRNGENFNLAEKIINQINEAYYKKSLNGEDALEFINKAFLNLFRENSKAIIRAIEVSNYYVKIKSELMKIRG